MPDVESFLPRHACDRVREALTDTRIVVINGIRHLAGRLGDRLLAGVVLYAGEQPLPFGDRLRAWPISALWTV